MGCWNKTCGLSNLHINAGDKAYVFVLEKKESNSHCYTTHLYRPLLLPFVTEYNEYGGGKNSCGAGFQIVLDAIKNHLVEMEIGENKCHDIAVKKDEFGEELFFDAVHEGRLFINNYSTNKPIKLEFVMFRKDIVDDILENRVIKEYVGDNRGTCGWDNAYIEYKFSDIVADIKPMIQEISEKFNDEPRFFELRSLFDHNHPNKAVNWLGDDTYRYSRLINFNRYIANNIKNDNLEAILADYLKGIYIDSFMNDTRKSWIPAGHEGSQNTSHTGHRLLMAAMGRSLDNQYWQED